MFKTAGPTSHDVVDMARRALGERRIGHTGTLDPMATGLLIDEISAVVVDSTHVFAPGTGDEYTGILYADRMTFRCRRQDPADPPPLSARASLEDVFLEVTR